MTVRYEAVNAMLLNEFLKEHRKVEEQQTKLGQQQGTIAALKSVMDKQQDFFAAKIAHQQLQIEAQRATAAQQQRQIETLTATVRKVSDQISLSKPSPQLVANP
jgi:peptidoglycan hydrolase CwlO-like protein